MPTLRERLSEPGPASLTLASVAFVLLLHWVRVPLLDLIELRTYDLRLASRGAVAPSPEVVLAVVDERSLDELGRWPWSRARMAELVDALSEDGARVIAFDIGFLEREASGPDGSLARAIARSRADVVLGYFFHMGQAQRDERADPLALEQLASTALTVRYRDSDPDQSPFDRASAPEGNLPELAAAAEGAGFFTLQPDPDGVLRRTPLVIQAGEEVFPSLALATSWHALGRPPLVVEVAQDRVSEIRLGERSVPTDSHGHLLLDFPGPAATFPHVSIADILAGELPPGAFRDRIVLVGVTATAIFDLRATPFGPVYPGLEVQATAIDNLLSGRFLTRPGWASLGDQLAIVALGVATGLLLSRVGALAGLLGAALLAAGYVAFARQLLISAGAWLDIVHPLLALATTYTAITANAYVSEQRARRKVANAFGQYVSPIVIEQMLAHPEQLKLGGEERVLTVLVSDLVGFTSIAEQHTPQQTIELLSEYYARMTESIYACQGMLKEYVGDELMAIFGAPVPQPDHAALACRAALALRVARAELSREWSQRGRPEIHARTGLNSGLMLVGNVGSKYRFSYGVVGDAVNVGSRLEGLNRIYGTEILLGEQTAALVGEAFRLREVDRVRALGKRVPMRIHELIGEAGVTLAPEHEKALSHYAVALAAYRDRRWAQALAELDEALACRPGDGPSRMLADRCRAHVKTPPPADWDGVYDATEK